MSNYRIGFIGAGTITTNHRNGLAELADKADIVAVCDINETAATELGTQLEAAVFTDYKQMLKQANLDCCLLALPHNLHLEIGLDVLRKGIHLFLEKPMALTTDECRQLMQAASDNRATIFVGHTHQYYANIRLAKKMIEGGKIGTPKIIYDEITAYYNWEKRKPWFLDPKTAGGGALFNTAPHQIDHLLFLGGKIKNIKACVTSLRPGAAIDSDSFAFLEFENGLRGNFVIFQGTKPENDPVLNCKIMGTEGTIQFNIFQPELKVMHLDQQETIACPNEQSPFTLEWQEFFTAIEAGRAPLTDAIYGHDVVAVLEAMVKSSATGSEEIPDYI